MVPFHTPTVAKVLTIVGLSLFLLMHLEKMKNHWHTHVREDTKFVQDRDRCSEIEDGIITYSNCSKSINNTGNYSFWLETAAGIQWKSLQASSGPWLPQQRSVWRLISLCLRTGLPHTVYHGQTHTAPAVRAIVSTGFLCTLSPAKVAHLCKTHRPCSLHLCTMNCTYQGLDHENSSLTETNKELVHTNAVLFLESLEHGVQEDKGASSPHPCTAVHQKRNTTVLVVSLLDSP